MGKNYAIERAKFERQQRQQAEQYRKLGMDEEQIQTMYEFDLATVAKETHKDANKDNKCDTCGYAIPKDADATTSTPDSTQTSGDSSTPSDSDTSSVIEPTNDESQGTDSESQETNGEPEEEDNKKEDNDITDEDDGNGAWIWMVLAIVIVLAAVGAVTFIVIKRKKPNN